MQSITQDKDVLNMSAVEQAAWHATARKIKATEALKQSLLIAEIERAAKLREAEIEADICAAQDADGKPLYSNADKRKAELLARTATDSVLVAAREEIDKAKAAAGTASIDAEYHRDMVRILTAFAQAEGER